MTCRLSNREISLLLYCCCCSSSAAGSLNLMQVFSFSSFKTRFFFMVPLGCTVSHLRLRFANVLANYGHAKAGVNPPRRSPSCIYIFCAGTFVRVLQRARVIYVLWWEKELCARYKRSSALKAKSTKICETRTRIRISDTDCALAQMSHRPAEPSPEKREECAHAPSRPYCAARRALACWNAMHAEVTPAAESNTLLFATLSGNIKIIWQLVKFMIKRTYIPEGSGT